MLSKKFVLVSMRFTPSAEDIQKAAVEFRNGKGRKGPEALLTFANSTAKAATLGEAGPSFSNLKTSFYLLGNGHRGGEKLGALSNSWV